eukprot:Gb_41211 [translate_table: standard]
MVLWELTLATAYVLGLKRTYKLALRLQRRLIPQRRPLVRQFVQRRTRAVFDVVLSVHKNIQDRDIEMGKSLGNWILQGLDRMKPSANIRGVTPAKLQAHKTRTFTETVGSTPYAGVTSINGKMSTADRAAGRSLFARVMPVSKACRGLLASGPDTRNSGVVQFKAGIFKRSLPFMAPRLWWQPVRHNIGAVAMFNHILYGSPQIPVCWQPSQFNSKGVSGGIIRKDIAVWMHQ